jgi:hypothetical protein
MEEKIRGIIKQVGDIGEKISRIRDQKSAPGIEIDIILEELRKLYEDVRNLRGPDAEPGTAKQAGQKPADDSRVEEAAGVPADPAASHPVEPADPQPERETELGTEPAKSGAEPKKGGPGEKKSNGKSQPEKSNGPSILADRYKDDKKFRNESLAGKRTKQDVSSKIQSTPIHNIGSALGINDRFKLINELFNGDKQSYEDTVKKLDSADNFNEAFNYINSSFDWDMEEESVQILLDLVRRKFIVNQDE